ncbi:hypothetical protein A3A25_01975 [Candidatus Azambacteria bacterium RIFCSPLOWO2_01_FULL_46_26]|uniref:Uncharacterized protein n=1 Tax=Candidatus Azambacteria bacterium RIFCSPLOWO2_01_FULL_46_26 TaxID=1797299 RepID=A0A1F5C7Z0_9BACT|nr:MAG: hypothetical protein A3A25_01975 [Candidatus Azambacteria bacterium RIFCSPLOWO2_01_FULL_46_26]
MAERLMRSRKCRGNASSAQRTNVTARPDVHIAIVAADQVAIAAALMNTITHFSLLLDKLKNLWLY